MKNLNPVKAYFSWKMSTCSNSASTPLLILLLFVITTPLFSQESANKVLTTQKSNTVVAPGATADTTASITAVSTADYDPLLPRLNTALNPDGKGNITFTPGLRIQTRYDREHDDNGNKNNDFFIRRLRLKGGGKVFDLAKYYFEVKIDNTGKFNRTPQAQVENAWLDFKIKEALIIRAGLFDMVFSRNALTSDSKLLLMDRSLIKGALTVLGIADNTVGVLVHGRPMGGRFSYGFGGFDNLGFEVLGQDTAVLARKSDGTMLTGRVGYNFFDPSSPGGYGDYRSSYNGQGKRLTISGNAAYLSKAEIGPSEFALYAYGIDLFFNTGGLVIEAEYDGYIEDVTNDLGANIDGHGYYVQAGYLVFPKIELAVRYQELEPDNNVELDKLMWTSLGINYYIKGHNLKIQGEYIFKDEEGETIDNDLFQVQLQFDF